MARGSAFSENPRQNQRLLWLTQADNLAQALKHLGLIKLNQVKEALPQLSHLP